MAITVKSAVSEILDQDIAIANHKIAISELITSESTSSIESICDDLWDEAYKQGRDEGY